jgi:hypothetical protein
MITRNLFPKERDKILKRKTQNGKRNLTNKDEFEKNPAEKFLKEGAKLKAFGSLNKGQTMQRDKAHGEFG